MKWFMNGNIFWEVYFTFLSILPHLKFDVIDVLRGNMNMDMAPKFGNCMVIEF